MDLRPKLFEHKAYAEAHAKLLSLRSELSTAQARLSELERESGALRTRQTREAAAEALLRGEDFDSLERERERLAGEFTRTSERVRVLERAFELQGQRLEQALRDASREILAGLEPEHRRLVGRLAKAATAFVEANGALAEMDAAIRAARLTGAWWLNPRAVTLNPELLAGDIRDWLGGAVARGLVDRESVPEAMLPRKIVPVDYGPDAIPNALKSPPAPPPPTPKAEPARHPGGAAFHGQ